MLDICRLGDEILKVKCSEVEKFDNSLKILRDAMFETLDNADGVGLAGPQVGVDKRIFIVSIPNENIRMTFVNPQITQTSVETGPYEEGCLSIPGLYHNVTRPLRVKVTAKDVSGKVFSLDADGLLARVIQHEYDHLEGRLFIDRLDEKDRDIIIAKYNKKFLKRRKRNA